MTYDEQDTQVNTINKNNVQFNNYNNSDIINFDSLKCICRIHPQKKLEIKNYQDIKLCEDCFNKFFTKLKQIDDCFKIKFDYPLWK